MPLLQVRDCPEDIYKKISHIARRQNRSISQQVIVLLEKGLGHEISNRERRKNLMERINSRSIPKALKDIDASALLREDRDR